MSSRFALAADHPGFEGHFPGHPIVPAVVLLAEVLARVEADTGRAPDAWTVASAKFLAPAGPGTELTLVHEEASGGGRRFEIRAGATLVASGTLARRAP